MASDIVAPTQDQLTGLVQSYLTSQPTGLGFVIGYAAEGFSNIFFAGNLANQAGQSLALNGGTPFELASVSKTFTATLYALQMQAQSNQNLTLGDFALGIGAQFSDIPITSLMTYSSGLPQDNQTDAYDSPSYLPMPYGVPGMLGYLAATSMTPKPPNERYTYSNLGFGLMGGALSPLLAGNGQNFQQLMTGNVFSPLDIYAIFFDNIRLNRLPLGYEYSGASCSPAQPGWELFPAYNGAGGVVATPNDMMQWLKFNMGLITNDTLTPLLPSLQSPATTVKTPWGDNLGLGWFLTPSDIADFPTVWKDGALQGFNSYIALLPSDAPGQQASAAGCFVLTNSGGLYGGVNNDTEICAAIANDVLYYMQGMTPPADKVSYPRSTHTRPVAR
ncbi:serine hydrolase domain-containing protein [Camelimonas sp. ID_303_24]